MKLDLQMMGLYPTRLLRKAIDVNVSDDDEDEEQNLLKRVQGDNEVHEVHLLKRGRLTNPEKLHQEGSVSSVQYVEYCCTQSVCYYYSQNKQFRKI